MAVRKKHVAEILDAVRLEGNARFRPAPLTKPPPGLPPTWVEVLTHPEPTRVVWDVLWRPMAKHLPRTIRTFKKALQGIGLLTTRKKPPSLVYVVTEDRGKDTYAYRGFEAGPVKHPKARMLPKEFLKFYQVHDGWVFLWGDSLGPLPAAEWRPLSDDPKSPASRFLSVFHNGGGGCLGFDLEEKPPLCYTVWSDADPQRVRNLWRTIDDWIAGQHGDLDPAS